MIIYLILSNYPPFYLLSKFNLIISLSSSTFVLSLFIVIIQNHSDNFSENN